jgi:hypothetical protein
VGLKMPHAFAHKSRCGNQFVVNCVQVSTTGLAHTNEYSPL